jgi:hypothetical protein
VCELSGTVLTQTLKSCPDTKHFNAEFFSSL